MARVPATRFDSALLIAIVAAEVILLLLLGGSSRPFLAAAVALGGAFFVIAYRMPDLAWALTWVATPFSFEWVAPGGAALAMPTEPMMALALGAWSLRVLAGGGVELSRSPLHAPLALVAGVALVSVLAGGFVGVGIKAWMGAGIYAAFGYLYFAMSPCAAPRRERWFVLAAASGAIWGLYGVVRLCLIGVSSQHAYGAARPFFTEHGTYAAYLAMLLPLPLLLSLERRGRARWLYGAAALAILLGVVFSFTRAAWLSLVLVLPPVLVAWAVRGRRWRALLLPAAVILLAGLGVVALGAAERLARHAGTVVESENVSNLERINRWMAAVEMTKDHPWLGVGYGAYAEAYPAYRRKTIVTELAYRHMGVHSEPLRIVAEMGAIGLAATLWFLGVAFAAGAKAARAPGEQGIAALAIVAGLATYAAHGLFNSYLGIDKISVPFWIGLGALAALRREQDRRVGPSS